MNPLLNIFLIRNMEEGLGTVPIRNTSEKSWYFPYSKRGRKLSLYETRGKELAIPLYEIWGKWVDIDSSYEIKQKIILKSKKIFLFISLNRHHYLNRPLWCDVDLWGGPSTLKSVRTAYHSSNIRTGAPLNAVAVYVVVNRSTRGRQHRIDHICSVVC